ncbi:MAG: hypothetical protein GC161_04465 [Planctomycetaceae bacterium]|nr:hypothetical protein [Planctomycetaceae bacterium]
MGPVPGSATAPADAFQFTLPPGWVDLKPTSMRLVNVGLADDASVECSLTLLGGDGGGLAANVDRWRAQVGLGPLAAGEHEDLPAATLLGKPAVRFDATGTYTGMGGPAREDFRMIGLLSVAPEGSGFLKFTGPADVLERESANFDAFAASLRTASAPAPRAPQADAAGTSEATGANSRDGLVWESPSGWKRGPDRSMRTVTYFAGPGGEVECYVAVLGGDGGGLKSNLDRWRQQMGAAPLTAAELAALERIPSLGGDAVLIEIPGSYRGMSNEQVDDALMLGAMALESVGGVPERAVFAKLIGPRNLAEAERASFRQFVASLGNE